MKVRIEADGSTMGTRVVTEDGRDISDRVTAVTFRHQSGRPPQVDIDLQFVPLHQIGEVDARMLGPGGKEVRRIEYADGTVDVFGQASSFDPFVDAEDACIGCKGTSLSEERRDSSRRGARRTGARFAG